jgi:hypothetical protein
MGGRARQPTATSDANPSVAIVARLKARRAELEQAALTRVYAIADPVEAADPGYAEGLRLAVSTALDYGFAALEHGEDRAPPVPTTLLAQARLAARSGVNLDTVLRRYFAGYTLFGDFLVGEVEASGLKGADLNRLLRSEAVFFDRLVVAVSEEYGREAKSRPQGTEERRAEQVRRLLDGELTDARGLDYELEATHLGLAAAGEGAPEALRDLAQALDRRLLLLPRRDSTWAWLGSRRGIDLEQLEGHLQAAWPAGISLAIGEPGEGIAAWRLTHRQALAALPIAQRGPGPFVHYADVALLASILQDDLLSTSLRQLYLAPLEAERDGGETLRETLRAYFAAEGNLSSAAAAQGVSRQAIARRLRSAERHIGRPLKRCSNDLELALRMDLIDGRNGASQSSPLPASH